MFGRMFARKFPCDVAAFVRKVSEDDAVIDIAPNNDGSRRPVSLQTERKWSRLSEERGEGEKASR
jgi:hypothetical protein